MKLKRYISLLLLAVYLFATGGLAYASLSCHCVEMKTEVVAHACCDHCAHNEIASVDGNLRAPCCSDHHSMEVELYTGSASDGSERLARYVAYEQLTMTPMEYPELPDPLVIGESIWAPRILFIKEAFLSSVGLRAPPVLA